MVGLVAMKYQKIKNKGQNILERWTWLYTTLTSFQKDIKEPNETLD